MQRMLILSSLLLATSCGSDAGTETTLHEAGGADPALPAPGTTGPDSNSTATGTGTPSDQTSPDPGTLPESDGNTAQTDPNSDVMPTAPSPTDPDPDITPTAPSPTDPDPDADMLPTAPSPTDPDPDMSQNEPDPTMMDVPAADAGTDSEPLASLSFATDIWPVWSMVRDPVFVYRGMGSYSGCTDVGVCHSGANPGAGLLMPDQETAYAQMMDTPSVSALCAGTQRVVVGDPDNSCLILFYEGRLGRQDLDWVDDAEIELMREWIRQGALP